MITRIRRKNGLTNDGAARNRNRSIKKVLLIFWAVVFAGGQATILPAVDIYLSLSSHAMRSAIGIGGFYPLTPSVEEAKIGRQIQGVITDDLLFSRYFNVAEGGPQYSGKNEEIKAWSTLAVSVLAAGNIKLKGKKLNLTAKLFDVENSQVIFEKAFSGDVSDYRYLAHAISDEIVKHITGENGIAHSKIVFSNNRTGNKELYLVDYDGYNLRKLTNDESIDILPKWSPKGDEIIFTTYRYGNPDLYAISTLTGRCRAVSTHQGINTSASFSPDGETIALTESRGATPNLFLIDKTGKFLKRLTLGSDISTSPSFAPNGKEIIFVSDAPGYPQLEMMDIDVGSIKTIYTDGIVDSPAWSPRGDKIAFVMRLGRQDYDAYVYDLASTNISRLTQQEGSNENPSWSSDGRFLVFSSNRSSKRELYVMAVDGSGARKLVTMEGDSSTPSWSP